jgi:hypothetical protein
MIVETVSPKVFATAIRRFATASRSGLPTNRVAIKLARVGEQEYVAERYAWKVHGPALWSLLECRNG